MVKKTQGMMSEEGSIEGLSLNLDTQPVHSSTHAHPFTHTTLLTCTNSAGTKNCIYAFTVIIVIKCLDSHDTNI